MIQFIQKHAEGIVVAVILSFVFAAGSEYSQEHAARVQAEQIKTAQTQIDGLQKQISDTAAQATKQIATLQKQAAKVQTPAQAIAAIPTITDAPLNVRPVPNAPTEVDVQALPLFQELEKGKQDAVALNACTTELKDTQQQSADKDTQIKALKKKKGFFARLKKDAEDAAITGGIGLAIGLLARK